MDSSMASISHTKHSMASISRFDDQDGITVDEQSHRGAHLSHEDLNFDELTPRERLVLECMDPTGFVGDLAHQEGFVDVREDPTAVIYVVPRAGNPYDLQVTLRNSTVDATVRPSVPSPVQVVADKQTLVGFTKKPELCPYKYFYCLSHDGLNIYSVDGSSAIEFIEASKWQRERVLYTELLKIPVFSLFWKSKLFKLWLGIVRRIVRKRHADVLKKQLFVFQELHRRCMMDVLAQCSRLREIQVFYTDLNTTGRLEEFTERQDGRRDEVAMMLEDIDLNIHGIVLHTCDQSLKEVICPCDSDIPPHNGDLTQFAFPCVKHSCQSSLVELMRARSPPMGNIYPTSRLIRRSPPSNFKTKGTRLQMTDQCPIPSAPRSGRTAES